MSEDDDLDDLDRPIEDEPLDAPYSREFIDAVRIHFYNWSGGFPPESQYQVIVHVDYARIHEDKDAVRDVLRAYMEDPNGWDWHPQ